MPLPRPRPPIRADAVADRLRAAGCVFAEAEAELLIAAAPTAEALAVLVERRAAGEPVEHVVGWAAFCGRRIAVEPGVFVPRRRTEFLVERATALLHPGAVVVDLCCGSGAVGAALAGGADGVVLYAVDIDPVAVRCAAGNVAPSMGRVLQGDLFDPLPPELRGAVDVVVANAPYVPSEAIPLLPAEARVHEPLAALDGGPDGLALHRRLAAEAGTWLRRGGHLLVETSSGQARAAVELVRAQGLTARAIHHRELETAVVIGRRRTRPATRSVAQTPARG